MPSVSHNKSQKTYSLPLMNKLLAIGTIFLLAACATKENKTLNNKTTVVCTTGIIANAFDSLLNPNDFEIIALMGPGTDPHLYKPTPKDVNQLKNADVIIANGLHLEGKMTDILLQLQRNNKVLFVSDGIPENDLLLVDENTHDPHIWFDPNLWSKGISACTDSIGSWYAIDKNELLKSKLNWQLSLSELVTEIEDEFATVDPSKKYFVTAHDAFSYYARRFSIQLKALQGISTQSEFGLKDITDLADFVIEHKVKTVYFESSIPKKSVEALQSACEANNHQITIDGPLYSDALGAPDGEAGDYNSMIRYNSKKIILGMKQ